MWRSSTRTSRRWNGRSTSRTRGTNPTPIIENIQALDLALERGANGEFLLHHNVGSPADGNDYGPLETPLGPKAIKRLGAAGGRPTNSDWSYFNLEWPGQGLIVAVGWPGQWAAEFARDAGRGVCACAPARNSRISSSSLVRKCARR